MFAFLFRGGKLWFLYSSFGFSWFSSSSLCFVSVSYTFCIAPCIIVHHELHVYIFENEIMLLVIDSYVIHDVGMASLGSFSSYVTLLMS